MFALTVRAAGAGTTPSIEEVPDPVTQDGALLVEALALGVCGTDRSMLRRATRRLPAGRERMVIGHESLGRVLTAPSGSGFATGDLVAAVVRRPDPFPCGFCASGEIDLCCRDDYAERGIAGMDGYGSERFLLEPEYAVHVDGALGMAGVLVEPASIVAKAWERIDLLASRRRGRALIVGAGPIGLLAALLATQRGYEVHLVDRVREGAKPLQAGALGAAYHSDIEECDGAFDAVLECAGGLVAEAMERTAPAGVTCLIAGVYRGNVEHLSLDHLSRDLVGRNKSLIAISSSNRRHFEAAQEALRRAPRGWAEGMMTRVVPLGSYGQAYEAAPEDIKSVVRFRDVAAHRTQEERL